MNQIPEILTAIALKSFGVSMVMFAGMVTVVAFTLFTTLLKFISVVTSTI